MLGGLRRCGAEHGAGPPVLRGRPACARFESVFCALFSVAFFGEVLTARMAVGFAFIFAAIVATQLGDKGGEAAVADSAAGIFERRKPRIGKARQAKPRPNSLLSCVFDLLGLAGENSETAAMPAGQSALTQRMPFHPRAAAKHALPQTPDIKSTAGNTLFPARFAGFRL